MTRSERDDQHGKGVRSSVLSAAPNEHASRGDESDKAPNARSVVPVIKASAGVLLAVWALITLSNRAGEEVALDAVPRIAMDDFVTAHRQIYLSPTAWHGEQVHGLYILDVRGENAYIDGHIRGALSVPEGVLTKEAGQSRIRSSVPDTASTVVLYCG